MSRLYKGIRAKKNRVYMVQDLTSLYRVSANTLSNWVKAGLRPSDKTTPYVFRGAVVNAFHEDRRTRSKKNLRAGEFKCGGCKLAVIPDLNSVEKMTAKNGTSMLIAKCPECPSRLVKIASQADYDLLERHRNPNTTVGCTHEENRPSPGGIWIKAEKTVAETGSLNDRTIYKWQIYAGRFEEATIVQHLAAIRYCDDITGGKPFEQFTVKDASLVREALKQSLQAQDGSGKSKSTVKHTASQLVAFFEWLRKQDGFKRLPQDIPEYFKLPRAAYSKSLPRMQRKYVSVEEAETVLMGMSARSHMDQRARAIFAMAFLGALRADTLVSLRIRHVDTVRRIIVQDATEVRAKNGKSLVIHWFPMPDIFAGVIKEWLLLLEHAGFTERDALFPDSAWLTGAKNPKWANREAILPMSTAHAVTEAFAIACRNIATKITPHSAKHTIAAERDRRHLTSVQRKAWSENMGHETEQTTQSHYGKLTENERLSAFEEIVENKTINPSVLSTEQKAEMFDAMLAKLKGY
ncbi:site-specific integrase [Roseobacter sp. OBYS 0001]|uniref:tyrosine-type recombinase/integrase n=1 Tax=Roseobacter sp. OBYS 0001 TaxID=882651 RepID=UPI001C82237A|nr:site-specific integrase [Roseobacter sp. OBYS 0001]